MSSFSRKRPASKGDIVPRHVRTSMNPITGQLEHLILDRVQLAAERMAQEYDRLALPMQPGERERFWEKVALLVLQKTRHTESDKDDPARALVLRLADRCEKQAELLAKVAERVEVDQPLETSNGG